MMSPIQPLQNIAFPAAMAKSMPVKNDKWFVTDAPGKNLLADVFNPVIQQAMKTNADFAVVLGPDNQTFIIVPEAASTKANRAFSITA